VYSVTLVYHVLCSCDLDPDTMTLTYELDLNISKMHLHTKNEVTRSRLSEVGEHEQDRQTDRQRQTDETVDITRGAVAGGDKQ